MKQKITIDKRFCGPPNSGQGGYVCGILGSFIGGTAEVTLRMPPPLEHEMEIVFDAAGARLMKGETVVADAHPTDIALDVPQAPSYAEAVEASKEYLGFKQHAYPTCFVCGPHRHQGDGLRIFAGPVPGKAVVAAPWIPDRSFAGADGYINAEVIWASLDCPGAFAVLTQGLKLILLGRLAVKIMHQVKPEEKCVVIGWPLSIDGRKNYAGTALFSESDALCAVAKATWIDLNKEWS